MSLKVKDGDDLEDFIMKFDDIIWQLKVIGADITEKVQIYTTILLVLLPQLYETVVTILENLFENQLTIDVIKVDSKPTVFVVNLIKCYFEEKKVTWRDSVQNILKIYQIRGGIPVINP